jgi:hypothetical protein
LRGDDAMLGLSARAIILPGILSQVLDEAIGEVAGRAELAFDAWAALWT